MKRIIEIGVYVLVFLLPWQTRWIISAGKTNGGGSEYLTYSLYGFDILLIALLVMALIYLRKNILTSIHSFMDAIKKGEFFRKKNIGFDAIFLFVLLGLISIFSAENKLLAMNFELRIFLAIGFFWLLRKFADKVKLAVVFVGSLILPATLAIWQFLSQQTFSNKWLGLAQHSAGAGGTSVIETFADGKVIERWLRAYGSFDHPNILGSVLAVGALICLWLLIEKWQYKILICMVLIILSTGVFMSFSRASWLSLFGGIISGAVVLFAQKKFDDLKVWFYGVIVIAVVFAVMFLNYQNLVMVRTGGNTRLENLSVDQRVIYLEQSREIIKKNKILGVGVGNYVFALAKSNPESPSWTYQPVHNVFLLIWSEMGIFGMLSFVFLYGFLFWRCGRKSFMPSALLIALLPTLLLDHWLWSFHFGILFFALAVALEVGFSEKERI